MDSLWLAFIGAGFGVVLAMAINLVSAEKILTRAAERAENAEGEEKEELIRKFRKTEFFIVYVQPVVLIVLSAFAAILVFGGE